MKSVPRPFLNPDRVLPGARFADSYAVTVDGLALDAASAAQRIMGRTPGWVTRLMTMRNLVMKQFRLKTGLGKTALTGANIGWFPVVSRSSSEVVLGFDDRHLDFRVLVGVSELGAGRQEITASTVVRTHNLLGRVYLAIVMPFHRIIVPAMLAQVLID